MSRIIDEIHRYVYEHYYNVADHLMIDDRAKFKLELGLNLAHEIITNMDYIDTTNPKISTFMGIPVEINYDDPEALQLWFKC